MCPQGSKTDSFLAKVVCFSSERRPATQIGAKACIGDAIIFLILHIITYWMIVGVFDGWDPFPAPSETATMVDASTVAFAALEAAHCGEVRTQNHVEICTWNSKNWPALGLLDQVDKDKK
jgi:hypothetical protein